MSLDTHTTHGADGWLHLSGSSSAPPIVLVHGAVFGRHIWAPQIERLERDYRIIAPDLPGHGALRDQPFSIAAALDHLVRVAEEHAAAQPAVWVGASMGGYITMALAREHPERVAGLVLSGCSVNFLGLIGLWTRFVAAPLTARLDREWFRRRMAKRATELFPEEHKDACDRTIAVGFGIQGTAAFFREAAGVDFQHMVSDLTCPVLVLNGEGDRRNCNASPELVRPLRQAEVQTLKDAGHACSLEQPDAFTSAVASFAGRVFP